jgi:hypothetical protein
MSLCKYKRGVLDSQMGLPGCAPELLILDLANRACFTKDGRATAWLSGSHITMLQDAERHGAELSDLL